MQGGKTTVHLCNPTLPPRGLPWLSRSRASPRPVRWVQGLGGIASERIATLYLDAHGTGLGSGLDTFSAAPKGRDPMMSVGHYSYPVMRSITRGRRIKSTITTKTMVLTSAAVDATSFPILVVYP